MTIESLDKLEAQEAKAKQGEWFAAVQKPDALFTWLMSRTGAIAGTAGRFTIADAEFIAALRNSASDLFEMAREALEKREIVETAVMDLDHLAPIVGIFDEIGASHISRIAHNLRTPSRDMAADKEQANG